MPTTSLRHADDDALVHALRAGEEEAFEEIHRRYRVPLERSAARMVAGRVPGPEDIVQEVFARAFLALRADDRPVQLRPWLYRLTRNRALDELRRTTATVLPPGFDLPGDGLDPARVLGDRQRTRQVLDELRRLPRRQRDALVGHAVQGRSARELASSLGTSEKAVKALTHRGRTTLQRRAGRSR